MYIRSNLEWDKRRRIMARIITFGEIMLRLNPESYLRFTQSPKFEASYAGGEANVAVSLANYGLDAAFVSKVPAHDIGQCAVNALRKYKFRIGKIQGFCR
jgi:2-dehydro-3-deoxygluconokinase